MSVNGCALLFREIHSGEAVYSVRDPAPVSGVGALNHKVGRRYRASPGGSNRALDSLISLTIGAGDTAGIHASEKSKLNPFVADYLVEISRSRFNGVAGVKSDV